jgi:hypothetical protein
MKLISLLQKAGGCALSLALVLSSLPAYAQGRPKVGEAAAKALAQGYQNNYLGQRNLPENATPAQRQAVARSAFGDYTKEMKKEQARRDAQMDGIFAGITKDFNAKMKEQEALKQSLGLDDPGGDKKPRVKDKDDYMSRKRALLEKLIKDGLLPPGTKELPALTELAKLMGKGVPKLSGGDKGAPAAGGKGAPASTATGRTAAPATTVTGAEGAKDVKFGKEKELQIKDGIIQDQ